MGGGVTGLAGEVGRRRAPNDERGAQLSILCIVDQIGGLSNGAAIRQHHLVRAVAGLGDAEVLVLDPAAKGREAALTNALGAPVTVADIAPVPRAMAMLRMFRHPLLSWRLARSDRSRIAEAVDSLTRNGREPDLLWVSSLPGFSALSTSLRARTVFDLIDRPTVFHAEQLRVAARRWRRSLRGRRHGVRQLVPVPTMRFVLKSLDGWARGYLTERWLTRSCRLVVSCNPDELPRRAGQRHQTVANCMSPIQRVVPAGGAPLRLLYPAGLKYGPNLDGAEWFLADVLPHIRRIVDPCEVVFAGSCPPGLAEQAREAGVTATGWVPDMAEQYVPGTVVIVPLLGGSGTRVKIIEAWAMGVPVISTPRGASGLGASNGVDLLLARSPAEFASACRQLASPTFAAGIAEAGRRRYDLHFSDGVVSRELQALLRRECQLPGTGQP